ncbi:MAG: hypothetical protein DSZ06_00005, partial [Sulfurospirillum sp.]
FRFLPIIIIIGLLKALIFVGVLVGGVVLGLPLRVVEAIVGATVVVEGGIKFLLAVLLLGIALGVFKGIFGDTILVFLFFILLPFINAIFDYISMYFSRLYAENILKTTSKFKIFWELILDAIIAVVLLFSLAYTLYHGLDFVNNNVIKDKELFIPIEYYKKQILHNPLHKDVLWITMMFFSTIIPTLLHMFLAIYAFIGTIMTKPHIHELVNNLNLLKPNDPNYLKKEEVALGLARVRLADKIQWYILGEVLLIVLFLVVLSMLLIKKGFFST